MLECYMNYSSSLFFKKQFSLAEKVCFIYSVLFDMLISVCDEMFWVSWPPITSYSTRTEVFWLLTVSWFKSSLFCCYSEVQFKKVQGSLFVWLGIRYSNSLVLLCLLPSALLSLFLLSELQRHFPIPSCLSLPWKCPPNTTPLCPFMFPNCFFFTLCHQYCDSRKEVRKGKDPFFEESPVINA